MLIVDETHFGARADKYGSVLRNSRDRSFAEKDSLSPTLNELAASVKAFDVDVTLHLSGTPYRILMGDEFKPEDIIAFCQFSDIVDAKEAWNRENLSRDDVEEWSNPYFGFPQMIRFAFNPNASIRQKIRDMKQAGVSASISTFFKPKSLNAEKNGDHRVFVFEKEVLDFLRVIDGTASDDAILGFLDYDRIKNGKMCRHMVFVLPYCASCDALAALLEKRKGEFKNLSTYRVLNISGHDMEKRYETTSGVKKAVEEYELSDQKTITLTVNRMLTGSTVPEWDTMLYLKDGSSPQEYDQAVFRLQNKYVVDLRSVDKTGQVSIVKYDKKPQTLLVDFDVDRMFRLQELKSQIYNLNSDNNGNQKLAARIQRELEISPIIILNKGKLERATATNIMDAVRNYSASRSIADEAADIRSDVELLSDETLLSEIREISPIDAKQGLEIKPIEEDAADGFEIPSVSPVAPATGTQASDDSDDVDDVSKRLAAYFARILIFAFLSETRLRNLEEVIEAIVSGENANRRIAKNVGLKIGVLKLIAEKSNPFTLRDLDYRIDNINTLDRDSALDPIERVGVAMRKFDRISDTEIRTPDVYMEDLVGMLSEDVLRMSSGILDFASVQGVAALKLCAKYPWLDRDRIYALPTSSVAYELTRKVYKILGIPEPNVLKFKSNDLLDHSEDCIAELRSHGIDVVVGTPPFGARAGGGRGDGRKSEYESYFNAARVDVNARWICMLTKATWYCGEKGQDVDDFRAQLLTENECERHVVRLHDYPDPDAYASFASTLRGGVSLFLWDREYDGICTVVNRINHKDYEMTRPLCFRYKGTSCELFIRWNAGLPILQKVLDKDCVFLDGSMCRRNPFGLAEKDCKKLSKRCTKKSSIKVYQAKGKIEYIAPDKISNDPNGLLNQWKVLIAKASPGEDKIPHRVISSPIVAEPMSITAFSHYLIGGVNSELEANNLAAYMKTRFFRFMVNLLRANQNMRIDMYRFVPRLDFSIEWTDEMLFERYKLTQDERDTIKGLIAEW